MKAHGPAEGTYAPPERASGARVSPRAKGSPEARRLLAVGDRVVPSGIRRRYAARRRPWHAARRHARGSLSECHDRSFPSPRAAHREDVAGARAGAPASARALARLLCPSERGRRHHPGGSPRLLLPVRALPTPAVHPGADQCPAGGGPGSMAPRQRAAFHAARGIWRRRGCRPEPPRDAARRAPLARRDPGPVDGVCGLRRPHERAQPRVPRHRRAPLVAPAAVRDVAHRGAVPPDDPRLRFHRVRQRAGWWTSSGDTSARRPRWPAAR